MVKRNFMVKAERVDVVTNFVTMLERYYKCHVFICSKDMYPPHSLDLCLQEYLEFESCSDDDIFVILNPTETLVEYFDEIDYTEIIRFVNSDCEFVDRKIDGSFELQGRFNEASMLYLVGELLNRLNMAEGFDIDDEE